MPRQEMEIAEVGRLGDEIYERDSAPGSSPSTSVSSSSSTSSSGDYEIDDDDYEADRRSEVKHPDGVRYLIRIGYPAAFSFGGGMRPIER